MNHEEPTREFDPDFCSGVIQKVQKGEVSFETAALDLMEFGLYWRDGEGALMLAPCVAAATLIMMSKGAGK